jgi:hypothetical protein
MYEEHPTSLANLLILPKKSSYKNARFSGRGGWKCMKKSLPPPLLHTF